MRPKHPHTGPRGMRRQIVGRPGNDGGKTIRLRQTVHRRADPVPWFSQHRERHVINDLGMNRAVEAAHGQIGGNLCARVGIPANHGDGFRAEQRGRIEPSGRIKAGYVMRTG